MNFRALNFKALGVVVAVLAVCGALTVAATRSASAKPEFAAATGKPCGACHVSPGGGGQLTGAGEKYKKTLK
jgi:hypothetical protein